MVAPRPPIQLGHPLHVRVVARVPSLLAALLVVLRLRQPLVHAAPRAVLVVALLLLARVTDVPTVVTLAVRLVVLARLRRPRLRLPNVHPPQLSHPPVQRRELVVLTLALAPVLVVDLV